MKKQQNKQVVSIDQFDPSLWQLIPAGTGKGLKHLKTIVDAELNGHVERDRKPLSVLIVGKQGVRTHGRAFLLALGLEHIDEIPSRLLQVPPGAIREFFDPSRCANSYIISSVDFLYPASLKIIYEIITKGVYSTINSCRKITEFVPMSKPIVLTTRDEKQIPRYLKEKINHIVKIEDYSSLQLELTILQRLKYARINYEEVVLEKIVQYGHSDLHQIVRILKDAITVMLADDRTILTVADVKRVITYL